MTSHTPAFSQISLWSYGVPHVDPLPDEKASDTRQRISRVAADKEQLERDALGYWPDWGSAAEPPSVMLAEYDFVCDEFHTTWLTGQEVEDRWGLTAHQSLPSVATYIYERDTDFATTAFVDRHAAAMTAHSIARRLATRLRVPPHTRQDREDFEQDAVVAMLDRLSRFDPERGSLAQFAERCLSNLLIDRLRMLRWRREHDELVPSLDLRTEDDPVFASACFRSMYAEALDIPDLALAIDGYEDGEVAEATGSSYDAARQRRLRAARKFRQRWSD